MYDAVEEKWLLQENEQPVDNESLILTTASIPYFLHNSVLKHPSEIFTTRTTLTAASIDHLEKFMEKQHIKDSAYPNFTNKTLANDESTVDCRQLAKFRNSKDHRNVSIVCKKEELCQ